MKATRLIFALSAMAAALPLSPAAPAPAPSAQRQASTLTPEQKSEADHYLDCYKQFRETLKTIDDEATANAAIPVLDKLNDEFKAFLELPKGERSAYLGYFETEHYEEMEDIYSGYQGEYLRIAESGLLFENEGLVYELVIREHPASYYFQDAEIVVSSLLMPDKDKKPDPVLAQFRKEHMDSHQDAHNVHVQTHPDIYAGGDGTSEATAIDLLPFIQGKADSDKDRDTLNRLINEYLWAVYPDSGTAYAFYKATPDGSFYHIREIIYGLYTGTDGKQHIKTHTVFFRTSGPRPAKR